MDERDTKAVVLFPYADVRKSGLLDGALFSVKVSRGGFIGKQQNCSYPVV